MLDLLQAGSEPQRHSLCGESCPVSGGPSGGVGLDPGLAAFVPHLVLCICVHFVASCLCSRLTAFVAFAFVALSIVALSIAVWPSWLLLCSIEHCRSVHFRSIHFLCAKGGLQHAEPARRARLLPSRGRSPPSVLGGAAAGAAHAELADGGGGADLVVREVPPERGGHGAGPSQCVCFIFVACLLFHWC